MSSLSARSEAMRQIKWRLGHGAPLWRAIAVELLRAPVEVLRNAASGAPLQQEDGKQEKCTEESLVQKQAPLQEDVGDGDRQAHPQEACREQQTVDGTSQPDPKPREGPSAGFLLVGIHLTTS